MIILSEGLALYLYMNSWENKESKGCSLSHQQDLQMVCSDILSVLKSLVKFL